MFVFKALQASAFCFLLLSLESTSSMPTTTEVIENLPVGAPTKVDVNKPEIQQFARFALQEYSHRNLAYEPLIVEIISGTEQVVSGMLYKLNIKFGESACAKGENNNCVLKANGKTEICDAEIWSQPWLDKGVPKVTLTCSLQ